jgi:serine/threonine-protein kinase
MTPTPHELPSSKCPAPDVIVAFVRGDLPAKLLKELAEHISGCGACASSLGALEESDPILSAFRRPHRGAALLDEPEYAELEKRARAIDPADVETPAMSAAAASSVETPSVARLSVPATIGNYRLLHEIGKGGMGVVYKAIQEPVERVVALKMMRAGLYATADDLVRFRTDGKSLARLAHPNVIQLYDFDEHAGLAYFTMQFAEGGSLARRIAGQRQPPREAARLVLLLALAVEAAHKAGIVHRDLKPGNVLLMADGTPKVSDFGLAKLLDAENGQTQDGAAVGTPPYMAPEQAAGGSSKAGPLVDVYALGAILYELLTGKPPFRGQTKKDTLELVQNAEPKPPSRSVPGLALDLEAICLKCLEKKPANRYTSALALAEDLDNWLEGRPTVARPLGWLGRTGRKVRRHPVRAAGVVLALVAFTVGAVAWWYLDPDRPLREIERRLTRAESVTLIGEAGAPAWWDWAAGKQLSQASAAADAPFRIHSAGRALVEMVRNPRHERYLLHAKIRHDTSGERCRVGLFVAHHEQQTPEGPVHCYVGMTFNDVKDELDFFSSLPKGIVPPPAAPSGNLVGLEPFLYSEAGPQPCQSAVGHASWITFQPARFTENTWRNLTVAVTPKGIRGSFDGKQIGEVTTAALVQALRDWLKPSRERKPGDLQIQAVEPVYTPQGSLGICVDRGSISVKDVLIQPLTK